MYLVLLRDFVQEGELVVGEEGVGDPDLLREVTRQRQLHVRPAIEGQAIVVPVLQFSWECVCV